MIRTTIARWLIEHDVQTTARCYAQVAAGSGCFCVDCRNFMAGGKQFFPAAFQTLAENLGIDLAKPAELCHYGRDVSTGLHITGGFFPLVGSIVWGADVLEWTGASGSYQFERMHPSFEFGFGSKSSLVREPFLSNKVIQLDFMTQVPWVIADSDSECPRRGRSN